MTYDEKICAILIQSPNISQTGVTCAGRGITLTIDLTGVTNAAEVKLGAATNTVISGDGRDAITLTTGSTGNDVIRYNTAIAANSGLDEIQGFFAGSTGLDRIELASAGLGVSGGLRDTDGVVLDSASAMVFGTAISAAATLGAGNVIVFATGFASTGSLTTFLTSAGAITFATADMDGSGNFISIYTDLAGTDTYIALIHFDSGAAAQATMASAAAVTVTNLAVIRGVSPGAMVAANIDIV